MSSQTQLMELYPNVKVNAIVSGGPAAALKTDLPTIIFLHFWGGSARTWSLVNPIISAKPDVEDAYSISALADDVEAVIAALKIPEAVLVGLSMGAKVAQLVVARGKALLRARHARAAALHAYDSEESAGFVAANVLAVSYRDRALPSFAMEDMLHGNRWARMAWPTRGMAEDVSEGAGGISLPVLVLAADEDVVEPVERVRTEVCARIPGLKLVVLSDSRHLSPLGKPEAVAENLFEFLEKL
ncbi:hypothetical protein MFIFM68171_06663 [Madurella fahalii]|uniref:AB hydrolase-1 domain-containing protein n=1 Tax=Madurella fahalii TaxID=1157608 RepID=A0ABQ0GFC0_9PEZI